MQTNPARTSNVADAPDMGKAARAYASLGAAVFPLRGKDPQWRPGDLEHGKNDATTDPLRIASWWRQWPEAGIGIAMGPSQLVGYDVDPRNGGTQTHADLLAAHGPLPLTPRVETGRRDGGFHLYFRRPADVPARVVKLGEGIELFGNGYLVGPPSRHPVTGLPYRWTTPPGTPLARLPGWLAARMRPTVRLVAAPPPHARDGTTLGELFHDAGLVRARIGDRLAVVCPWADQHTSDTVSSTVVFPPGPATPRGWFHCSHMHCADRLQRDVWSFIGRGRR